MIDYNDADPGYLLTGIYALVKDIRVVIPSGMARGDVVIVPGDNVYVSNGTSGPRSLRKHNGVKEFIEGRHPDVMTKGAADHSALAEDLKHIVVRANPSGFAYNVRDAREPVYIEDEGWFILVPGKPKVPSESPLRVRQREQMEALERAEAGKRWAADAKKLAAEAAVRLEQDMQRKAAAARAKAEAQAAERRELESSPLYGLV